jgi:hypothetical protein
MSLKKLTLIFGVASLLVVLVGCSEDDPVSPQEMELTGDLAKDWTTGALAMVSEMATSVTEWADADFSGLTEGKSEEAPEWDPEQQAYIYSFEAAENEPPDFWEVRLGFWLQYRDEGTPVQYPLGADEMEARMTSGMTVHTESEEGVSDLSYDYATEMTVSNLETDVFAVVGTGETLVEASHVAGDQSEALQLAMDWEMDLTVSAGACPAGTAAVHAGEFSLVAVYNGQGGVSWTLTGPGYEATGNETLDCGAVP